MADKPDKRKTQKNSSNNSNNNKKNKSSAAASGETGKKRSDQIRELQEQRQRDRRILDGIWGVTILAIGIFLIITTQMNTTGDFGKAIHSVMFGLFGSMAYVLPYYFIVLALCLFFNKVQHISGRTAFFSILTYVTLCLLNSYRFIDEANLKYDLISILNYYTNGVDGKEGGAVGMELGSLIVKLIGKPGLIIISIAILAISVLLVVNTPISSWMSGVMARREEKLMMRDIEAAEAEAVTAKEKSDGRKAPVLEEEPHRIRILDPLRKSETGNNDADHSGETMYSSPSSKRRHDTKQIPAVKEPGIRDPESAAEFISSVSDVEIGKDSKEKTPVGTGYGLDGDNPFRHYGFGLDGYADGMGSSSSAKTGEKKRPENMAIQEPERKAVSESAVTQSSGPEYAPIPEEEYRRTAVSNPGTAELGLADKKPEMPAEPSGNAAVDKAFRVPKAAASAANGLSPNELKKANAPTAEDHEEVLRQVAASTENTANHKAYHFPPIDLLKKPKNQQIRMSDEVLHQKAELLEKTFQNFHVDARVLNVTQGSSVTRYEVQPAIGVKVSSITKLADDIALNMRAKSIRIEAPIPGKPAVGIEVENEKPSPVLVRELIDSDEFRNAKSKISFIVGKDISGRNIIADLKDMPHLLIAGATGSGKSVCINAIITSLLYKATPDEVRLILIDPKVVELGNYNGIPHMLIPVVTDPKKAAAALNWAVNEMNQRYKRFSEEGVKEIDSYNELMRANQEPEKAMPKVVIIIDELADLMMAASSQVEESICRLAQLARAAGMHLIVATQRPSVDIVTGLIKANIPSRIAFSVSSGVDSRTILDVNGAEKLLGKGDMLFSPVGSNKPIRIQGPYISDTEISKVIDFVKKQGESDYDEEAISTIEAPEKSTDNELHDELTEDAIAFILKSKKASVSMLQRRFRIGYNRAASIIDEIEARGIISPADGSRPRQVLCTEEEYYNKKEAGSSPVNGDTTEKDA